VIKGFIFTAFLSVANLNSAAAPSKLPCLLSAADRVFYAHELLLDAANKPFWDAVTAPPWVKGFNGPTFPVVKGMIGTSPFWVVEGCMAQACDVNKWKGVIMPSGRIALSVKDQSGSKLYGFNDALTIEALMCVTQGRSTT
jgi:hypothetical protein